MPTNLGEEYTQPITQPNHRRQGGLCGPFGGALPQLGAYCVQWSCSRPKETEPIIMPPQLGRFSRAPARLQTGGIDGGAVWVELSVG